MGSDNSKPSGGEFDEGLDNDDMVVNGKPKPPTATDIEKAKSTKRLILSCRNLKTLPGALTQLDDLATLDVASNNLKILPTIVADLETLTHLDLSCNSLKSLPAVFKNLEKLDTIVLSHNSFNSFPLVLMGTKVRVVEMEYNNLKALPALDGIEDLHTLKVSHNQISSIEKLPSRLQYLELGYNKLTEFPPLVPSLLEIDINDNMISEIPTSIETCEALHTLRVDRNDLTTIPKEIGRLSRLRALHLRNNKIAELPPEIGSLSTLRNLDISSNDIKTLIPEIGSLTSISVLNISCNRISELPDEIIARLNVLSDFQAADNTISTIPPSLLKITTLRTLVLSYNNIEEPIPILKILYSLTKLQTLALSGNSITTIETGPTLSIGARSSSMPTNLVCTLRPPSRLPSPLSTTSTSSTSESSSSTPSVSSESTPTPSSAASETSTATEPTSTATEATTEATTPEATTEKAETVTETTTNATTETVTETTTEAVTETTTKATAEATETVTETTTEATTEKAASTSSSSEVPNIEIPTTPTSESGSMASSSPPSSPTASLKSEAASPRQDSAFAPARPAALTSPKSTPSGISEDLNKSNLRELYLSGNKIEDFPDVLILVLKQLKILDLGINNLKQLSPRFIERSINKGWRVDVSYNFLDTSSLVETETFILSPQQNKKASQPNTPRCMGDQVVSSARSRLELEVACAGMAGKRETNEDVIALKYSLAGKDDNHYVAVFDGHGGRGCAVMLQERLHSYLEKCLPSTPKRSRVVSAIKTSFSKMSKKILKENNIKKEKSGSTAVVSLFVGDTLYVANVGDARAVLCSEGKGQRISMDHTPKIAEEQQRIRDAGGFVTSDGRVNGRLAVSRAFGDAGFVPFVSAEPHIYSHELTPQDQFLILACDGVWDVLSDQQAVDICLRPGRDGQPLSAEMMAFKLRDLAYLYGSTDNISVVVIKFKLRPLSIARSGSGVSASVIVQQ